MTSGTNRAEYKRHLADDLEREVIAFLNYLVWDYILVFIKMELLLHKKVPRKSPRK